MDSLFTTLPSHQRRLRNLNGIVCRNITLGQNPNHKEQGNQNGDKGQSEKGNQKAEGQRHLPDLFFTLLQWLPDDQAPLPDPFYTSELVKHSLNPSWRPFHLHNLPTLDTAVSNFIVQIWRVTGAEKNPVIEWKVDLRGLSFLAPELELTRVHPPNTLLFELTDGYYQADAVVQETDEVRANMAKVDKAKVKKSYTLGLLQKGTQSLMLKNNMDEEVDGVKRKIQQKLDLEAIILKKYEQKKALLQRQSFIRDEINRNKLAMDKEKQQDEAKRVQLRTRRETLQDSKNKLEIGKAFLEINTLSMEENRELLKTTVTLLVERRWELLSQLQKVFTVKPVDEKMQLFKVCDIPLPNTEYVGFDDEQVASALGYISQAVLAISNYFEIPLRYALNPAGSRSMIRDDVSYTQGTTTQDFPLYPKGVERFRFDYAVFLLNKDIEQLLNARGHGVSELKNTLPNIHTLLEHESTLRSKKHDRWIRHEEPPSGREATATPPPAMMVGSFGGKEGMNV